MKFSNDEKKKKGATLVALEIFFRVVIKKLKLKKIIIIELEYINITKKKKKHAQIYKVLKFPSQVFIF